MVKSLLGDTGQLEVEEMLEDGQKHILSLRNKSQLEKVQ